MHEPRIGYACHAEVSNEFGEFSADTNQVRWSYDLGDGMQASLIQPHAWQSVDDFRAHGFHGGGATPSLVIRFDRRFARNEWMQEPPRLRAAGEIRVGDQSRREWVSNLDMAVFSGWAALLAQEHDMEVVLIDTSDGSVLQRGVISRGALQSIEPTLQRLSAMVTEMERDPPARCTPFEEEEVIVT
jgi:hypothetical protein